MNETIVKTEKLTELKNLVIEIEELEIKKELKRLNFYNEKSLRLKKQKIYKLIKTL